jgi:hypothetical protein
MEFGYLELYGTLCAGPFSYRQAPRYSGKIYEGTRDRMHMIGEMVVIPYVELLAKEDGSN